MKNVSKVYVYLFDYRHFFVYSVCLNRISEVLLYVIKRCVVDFLFVFEFQLEINVKNLYFRLHFQSDRTPCFRDARTVLAYVSHGISTLKAICMFCVLRC